MVRSISGLILAGLLMTLLSSATRGDETTEPLLLFNGTDLQGWDGDARFWSVEDGEIVGQTSEENKAEQNTFLIYRDREFDDFRLDFEYQVEGYNSGVQYRSKEVGPYRIVGYQADFEARWHDSGKQDRFSGMFFEEGGRMFLAQRGQAVVVRPGESEQKPHIDVIGRTGDAAQLEQAIQRNDWNRYTVIAYGHAFTHIINDQVMAIAYDLDPTAFRDRGLIAFQLHSGPPMKIRLRNIRIHPLSTTE